MESKSIIQAWISDLRQVLKTNRSLLATFASAGLLSRADDRAFLFDQ
jgi:hypothetical protein